MAKHADSDREQLRRELKSGRFDPNTAHQPQEIRKRPTEGEKMLFGTGASSPLRDKNDSSARHAAKEISGD